MLEAYIVSLTLRYISLASTERTLWFGAKKMVDEYVRRRTLPFGSISILVTGCMMTRLIVC